MKGRGFARAQPEKVCGRCQYFQPTAEEAGVCVCKRSEVYQRSIITRGMVPTRKRADKACTAWRDVLNLLYERSSQDGGQGLSP